MGNGLDSVVNALPGLVWRGHPDGHADFFNIRWCEYTGFNVEDSLCRGWQGAVHSEDLPGLLDAWHVAVATGSPREHRARLVLAEHGFRWFVVRIAALTDESGRVVNWCGSNTDYEDRSLIEEEQSAQWWLSWPSRERHFLSVADSIPALTCLMTPKGELEVVNRQTLEFFGKTFEELKVAPPEELVHPVDLPVLLRASETDGPYTVEVRFRRADGAYRWHHITAFPLPDDKGRSAVWYFLQNDIDDRKRAEAILAGEKSLLEMIATSEPLSSTLKQVCLLVEELSSACVCCSILQLNPDSGELLPVASPRVPGSFVKALDDLKTRPNDGPFKVAIYRGAQDICEDIAIDPNWPECREAAMANGLRSCWSTPLFSQQHVVLGTLAMFTGEPATPTDHDQQVIAQMVHLASIAIERNRAEAVLRRSEAHLAEAQALSLTGSFGWIVASNKHFWSSETFRIFEYEPTTEASMQLIMERVYPDDVHLVRQAIDLGTAGDDFDYECRFVMPSGGLKFLQFVAHAARNQHDQLEYFGAVQDVTLRRVSEAALEKARADLAHMARVTTLGTLTASIAHEINQPLSGIVTNGATCLRMLAADPPDIEGAIKTAQRTIRDGNRASDVVKRLRALFEKKAPATEAVDLNDAAREVIELSSSELRRKRIIVEESLDDNLPSVAGDRVQLQQVMMNLLLNAAEAMGAVHNRPRLLAINTGLDQSGNICCSISDSGMGFEPGGAEKLFEAFYTTKSDGMGIGLAVSHTIIESHGGRLWATPNAGPGATFSFSIPHRIDHRLTT